MIKKEKSTILDSQEIAKDIYRLVIITPIAKEAKPGQFVNVYLKDNSRLLPRPISICDVNSRINSLTLVFRVVGAGTASLKDLRVGESVEIMGPLGNGYMEAIESKYGSIEAIKDKKLLVIGGGLGIPPMLCLLKKLCEMGADAQCILGYRDETFLKEDFEQVSDRLIYASDDGSIGTKGTVIDAIEENGITGDIAFSCGPLPMLRALKEHCNEKGTDLFVSLEERMACGVGACLGCVTDSTGVDSHSMVHNKRVCKDGPVFDAGEVVL